jgi:hypothetical protein
MTMEENVRINIIDKMSKVPMHFRKVDFRRSFQKGVSLSLKCILLSEKTTERVPHKKRDYNTEHVLCRSRRVL